MKVLDVQRNMIKNVQVGLPVREEHDALEDAADCRRICRRMAGTQRSWHYTNVQGSLKVPKIDFFIKLIFEV